MKRVSVVIPAYNSAQHLKEALDSVHKQTYPIFETIVIDDGSTDNTAEIAKRFGVKYIYQENRGPAAARNVGIKEASGEYVAFLDSDDIWMPEKTERQIAQFDRDDFAMIYCDMSHMVDGTVLHRSYLKEREYKFTGSGFIFQRLLKENFIFTPTVIIRKDALEGVRYFDETYRICEDYKMWLSISERHRIGFVDEPLVMRRRTKSNITQDRYLYLISAIRLFEELMKTGFKEKALQHVISTGLSKRVYQLGYYYWDKGDLMQARVNFFKSIKYGGVGIFKVLPYIMFSFFPGKFAKVARGFLCRV